MIRMIQSRSSARAKAYFSDALAKADYYVSDQELPGLWRGRLAARLGLSGVAARDEFFALAENKHPKTGAPLTPRLKENRTAGYDINFHCPKSVSLLHALSPDSHIMDAFSASVEAVMKRIESDSQTRVRKGGRQEDRRTGELAWASFLHQTARPVEGRAPDPHLHMHCYVFNATWDAVEQRTKAAQFRDAQRDMPYYQALFHKDLSDRLIGLGYQVRPTDTSFEVVGVPRAAIAHFSKRTDAIGRVAKELGITDAKELSGLGARTRGRKQKGLSMEELRKDWRSQIAALPMNAEERDTPIRHAPIAERRDLDAGRCVDHAVKHCFERASVMDGRRIEAVALRRALGIASVTAEGISQRFDADKRMIHVTEKGRKLCTTKAVLNEERRMVALARAGQGSMLPLYRSAPALALTGAQARAASRVLTTPHRVTLIRGVAGSGKTTMMKETVSKIEAAGKRVLTVAPTARASRGVLAEEGFKNATTVAQLLVDRSMQEKLKGQVLWVDEAGLLGTKDMTALLELTARQNARLILSGDTRQHASVVRGDALRILNTVGGLEVAEVNKIHRQKSAAYRAVVKDLSEGKVAQAFAALDRMGCIKDLSEHDPVRDYVAAVKAGKSALLISPTHAQGEEITNAVRETLKREGVLGKKEIEVARLRNLNLTEAERADPENFAPGHVVQFTQNAPGFTRGSRWTVTERTESEVRVESGGAARTLPLDKAMRYEVFALENLRLAKGDRLRITKNGYDQDGKRLNNGDALKVAAVSAQGSITLKNDISGATHVIGRDFGHLAHAHCVTSHAAQGRTVDEVFIFQPAATFPATDAKQFYVSVSRARDIAHIYTDNREELLHHAEDTRERPSAIELIRRQRHYDALLRRQRMEIETPKQKRKEKGHGRDL